MWLSWNPRRGRPGLASIAVAVSLAVATAQTRIVPPKNKYTPEQDVELGRKAAAESRQKLPIIENVEIDRYLDRLGERLVAAAPADLRHPAFEFSFTPVNQKDINAFALPGGPMFVNRGMIEAASREDEVVGVMAHELSHVLLRHGTANVTKAQSPGITLGAIAGAIAGAVVGGPAGGLINDASQFGLGAALLRYSRDYEKQADLLGVQIMARAGYDPAALAEMFATIQKQGSGGGPQWLSSHPNPGNRTQYILAEAKLVQVGERPPDTEDFDKVRSTVAALPSTGDRTGDARATAMDRERLGTFGDPVPPPAGDFRTLRAGQFLEVSVPSNWNALSSNSTLRLLPPNAYGEVDGQAVYSHGVEIGVVRGQTRDLRQATSVFLDRLYESNRDLRFAGQQQVRPARRPHRAGFADGEPRCAGRRGIRDDLHDPARRRAAVLLRHDRTGRRGRILRPRVSTDWPVDPAQRATRPERNASGYRLSAIGPASHFAESHPTACSRGRSLRPVRTARRLAGPAAARCRPRAVESQDASAIGPSRRLVWAVLLVGPARGRHLVRPRRRARSGRSAPHAPHPRPRPLHRRRRSRPRSPSEQMRGKQAVLETDRGTIVIDLLPEAAPNHVGYFMKLAGEGAYDGTTFHRAIKMGIVQGGDPLSKDPAKRAQYGTGGLGLLKREPNGEKATRGAVAAVLQPGKPDSAGSQFFLCVTDQPALDGQYTVFGRVSDGIEAVQAISEARRRRRRPGHGPYRDQEGDDSGDAARAVHDAERRGTRRVSRHGGDDPGRVHDRTVVREGAWTRAGVPAPR